MTEVRILPAGEPTIGQVAFVTRDLDAALARWVDLGVGPWNIFTFDDRRMSSMSYRGEPAVFSADIALCSSGPMTYEVIQPLSGPSIWEDFLGLRGEGLHHVGYYVDDIGGAIAAMTSRGYAMVQSGSGFGVDGDGAFAYFDAIEAVGCYLEAILGPTALAPPERHFP